MTNLHTQDVVPSSPYYRLIPLTKGQFAIVDEADFDWLNQWPWFAIWSPTSKGFYAARRIGIEGKQKSIWMHNVILDTPRGRRGDHISGNTLDNRRTNLRIATRRGNSINRRLRSDNTSGHVGVQRDNRWNGCWEAFISVKGKRVRLGRFKDLKDAISAREKGEMRYYGEYSRKPVEPIILAEQFVILRPRSVRNKSGYTGVCRCHAGRRGSKVWVAYVRIGGKPKHLGYFYTPEEASEARTKFIRDQESKPQDLNH